MLLSASQSNRLSSRPRILPGMMLFALALLAAPPVFSQSAAPDSGVFSPAAKAQPRVMTPRAVLNGDAKLVSRYPSTAKLRVVLGLTPPRMAEEEAFLQRLQDKNSPDFHKFLTAEEWNARFAPGAADEQAVVDWATANGLTVAQRFPNRLLVDLEGDSATIEKAFAVQINSYQVGAETEFSNDRDPAIPSHLQSIIQSVGGLNSIERAHAANMADSRRVGPDYSPGPVHAAGKAASGDADPSAMAEAGQDRQRMDGSTSLLDSVAGDPNPGLTNGLIDPTDIYSSQAYNYGALQNQGHCCNPTNNPGGSLPATSLAIATSGDFADSDLVGFHNRYGYLAWNYHRWFIDGTPACCNGETTLDVEWSIATTNSFGSANKTAQIWVYEGADNHISTFTDVYNYMLSDGLARVFTTSWGCEELGCTGTSTINTDHAIFNAMIGQGWTILADSGDQGATDDCSTLSVQYPPSDPDVIGVGGTWLQLYSGGQYYKETAWQGSTKAGSCKANGGGSGGGCSKVFAAPGFQSKPYCGKNSRSVPDIALNANGGQNLFFQGAWSGVGGTSIATPEVAGFMVQENAYLMSIGVGCGTNYKSTCAPMGNADWALYQVGYNKTYAPHYPFYDITSGCNGNDITATSAFFPFCAGPGYDAVTGWGSFNALQLSWAISTYLAGDFGAPTVTFAYPSGYSTANPWYNSNQILTWKVADTNNGKYATVGVAGFTQVLDGTINDPVSQATPGTGNSYYSGPEFPNATTGYMYLANMGQGCHKVTVDAWDNTGFSSGNQKSNFFCYDTVAPTMNAVTAPQANAAGWYNKAVTVTMTAADPGTTTYNANGSIASGIAHIYANVDSKFVCNPSHTQWCSWYSAPIVLATEGPHQLTYFAKDKAGNSTAQSNQTVQIDLTAPVTKAALAGTLVGTSYVGPVTVTLTATDNLSGVQSTMYSVDGFAASAYTAPITVNTLGNHTIAFYSVDKAGNTEKTNTLTLAVSTTTAAVIHANPTTVASGSPVTFSARVTAAMGGNPRGIVDFVFAEKVIGTGTLNSDGNASATISTLPKGNDAVTARYMGSTFDRYSVSKPVIVTVN